MKLLGHIRAYALAILAGAVALLFMWSRLLSSRLAERDRVIREQQGYVDTTKRIQQPDQIDGLEDADAFLKERAGEE